jgi:hypothetical protein
VSAVSLLDIAPLVGARMPPPPQVSAAEHAIPGSDAQPSSEQCNFGYNLHPDSAAFTGTGQQPPPSQQQQPSSLSRPVKDCDGYPALAGARKSALDDPSAGRE